MRTDFEILETPDGLYRLMAAGLPYDDYPTRADAQAAQRELEGLDDTATDVVHLPTVRAIREGHQDLPSLAWLADSRRRS